jgi:hypothetical protein
MGSECMSNEKSTVPKPFIFVLMPFDEKFNDLYEFGIQGAAKEVNAYAERVDNQIFNENILDRIFNQINKADVIVADMTGRNPNVFYEVGYAHALGKIVLLLTQNTNDIPFDLKHRQHIIYAGQIAKLRNALVERLTWAIGESKKQRRYLSERFLVSIFGTEIQEASLSHNVPTLKVTVLPQNDIELLINIRNGSLEMTPNITHIYLFASADSKLLPGELDRNKYNWMPLDSMEVPVSEAFDGLSKQYRLNATIPALPFGAVDKFTIHFMLSGKHIGTKEFFKIRIHSSNSFYDFPFIIEAMEKT